MSRVVIGGLVGGAIAEFVFIFTLPKHMQDGETLLVLLLAGVCIGACAGETLRKLIKA